MRWHIIRTLLGKEVRRQLANKGGLVLAALLVVATLLMTFFSQEDGQAGVLTGGVEYCFVDYWQDGDWVRHLRAHVPDGLSRRIKFRSIDKAAQIDGHFVYPAGAGAIQMRAEKNAAGQMEHKVSVWLPGQDARALADYELWFWRETAQFFRHKAAVTGDESQVAPLTREQTTLKGGADVRSSVTVALVLFALFFSCVYLLPSLMCEERERGILLAQALSPASPVEILAAKFLFYPAAGMGLAAVLAGIARPLVLAEPFFWLALLASAVGSLGIGLTIASLAKTQRAASMGALCYMLVVTLFLFICQQGNIKGPMHLALEYHSPRMLHAVLGQTVYWFHWVNLAATTALAAAWCAAATYLFRTRGWQ